MVWVQFLCVWSGHSFFIQEKEKIHVPANIRSLFVLRKVEICACLIGHYARVQNLPTFSFIPSKRQICQSPMSKTVFLIHNFLFLLLRDMPFLEQLKVSYCSIFYRSCLLFASLRFVICMLFFFSREATIQTYLQECMELGSPMLFFYQTGRICSNCKYQNLFCFNRTVYKYNSKKKIQPSRLTKTNSKQWKRDPLHFKGRLF